MEAVLRHTHTLTLGPPWHSQESEPLDTETEEAHLWAAEVEGRWKTTHNPHPHCALQLGEGNVACPYHLGHRI